ncbi:HPP family-domain-containing protein [Baffinella frigidus]|nr:HPP family-domain-containing protein [Cryptophyta sp. CCMP2293]
MGFTDDFKITFDPVDLLFSAGAATVAFMVLHFVHLQLAAQGFTAMCPPLGAVAVILFAAPGIPAAKPYNVAIGFLAGSAAAYGIYTGLGENFLPAFGGTRAVMVGSAIAAMKITNSVHPPMGAYAVLLADVPAMKALGAKYILCPGLTGALTLLAVQFLFTQIKKALKVKQN